jgi:hypothetical protein
MIFDNLSIDNAPSSLLNGLRGNDVQGFVVKTETLRHSRLLILKPPHAVSHGTQTPSPFPSPPRAQRCSLSSPASALGASRHVTERPAALGLGPRGTARSGRRPLVRGQRSAAWSGHWPAALGPGSRGAVGGPLVRLRPCAVR